MSEIKVSEGIQMLVARHKAAGAEIGTKAFAAMKKISNVDPSEGIWNEGDEFTVPSKEALDQACFVGNINGNDAPAIAVDLKSGGSKVLYISSLKKNVVEYEQDDDEYRVKRNADGSNMPAHYAGEEVGGTPLRKEVMSKATVGDIAEALAGRTFKVAKIMGPFQTSRLKAEWDEKTGRNTYKVVGLRRTTIPVFEEVK